MVERELVAPSSLVSGSQAPGEASHRRARGVRVWALTAAVYLVAAALFAVVASSVSPMPSPFLVGLIVCGFAAAEHASVNVRIGRHACTLTLSEIPFVVGLFFLPPALFVLARVAGAVLPLAWRNRRSLRKLVFNVGLYWLEAGAAVICWQLVLGGDLTLGPRAWLAVGAAVFLAEAIGAVLIAVAIAADGGTRPGRRSVLLGLESVAPLLNASAALIVVYVVTVDWRAIWTVGVVVAVLFFAQQAHDHLRRRTESLEQLSRFTAEIGGQLDVESAARAAVVWMTQVLEAETVELALTGAFAGRPRRWVARYGDAAAEVDGDGRAAALAPWLDVEPLLVRRRIRDRALARAMRAADLRDVVAMSLQGDGEVIGTLLVGDRLGDVESFGTSDLRELKALGNHLSVTLRNARRADLIGEHAADQLRRSRQDELTGLPNRRFLEERLAELLAAGGRAAAVMLDLDRFKEINDTLGHGTGDALLQMVADRLRGSAPPDAVVARLGGDEFAVLLAECDDVTTGSVVAMLRHAFALPFDLVDLQVTVEASLGVATSEAGAEPSDLLRQADLAMYAAKARRTGVETYRRELDAGGPQRLTMLTELRAAIANGELTVHFQPKVRLRDGAVVGAEALVRWAHPGRGLIGPDEFIPVAEHSGLLTPLTFAVLRQSLDACESWRRAGRALGIAINISPRSLLDPSFVDEVARALAAVEVPASAVTLEITESSLMTDPERAIEALARLRSLGLRLSIDDLGTGYSSLAYLARLPVSEVKIDRSFLSAGPGDADSWAIVGAIVGLGQRLGRDVVAEGVQNESTWRALQQLGCDTAQGYWMSPPLPGPDFLAWLTRWQPGELSHLRVLG